ncbi:methyl-accepting chemotaxis protein [Colwellia sp. MEBiC06753]
MPTLNIKQRIILLALAPIVLLVAILMFIVNYQLTQLGEQEVAKIESSMLKEKKVTLKNYVDIALSSIEQTINDQSIPIAERQRLAADKLRSIVFEQSKDGYIFVYKYDGTNIVTRTNTSLEGKNLIDLKDPNGVLVIKGLIDIAKSGGGYFEYQWLKASKNANVSKLSYAVSLPQFDWMVGTGFYIDDIEEEVAKTKLESERGITQALLYIVSISVIAIIIVVILSLYIAGRITKPLHDTVLALDDISQGEGDLTQRLKVYLADEVGAVAKSFNMFVDKIHRSILELKTGAENLTDSTTQMGQVVNSTNANVDRQRSETTQAASAIQQMATTAQQVAASSAGAAEAARDADIEANKGQQTVEETIAAITNLSEEIIHAAEVINQLSNDADNIGNVLNVIKDIADQTNLLALNAAIEAARAGEMGRGFSVVADEVRTLANRTQQSTEEIQTMIERLQAGASNAVSVMESSQTKGQQTVEKTAEAKQSLATITQSVGVINEMNTQIATAAEQQTAVANEISVNVQQVADIAEESSVRALELTATAEQLIQLEQQLSNIVNQFKV